MDSKLKMRKDYNARYELIIERLDQSPATYSEIETHLLESDEFARTQQKSYSIRTLQRDIRDIKERLGVVIKNSKRKDNPVYSIRNKQVLESESKIKVVKETVYVSKADDNLILELVRWINSNYREIYHKPDTYREIQNPGHRVYSSTELLSKFKTIYKKPKE